MNDATAAGLVKKMKNAKFIGALYILAEVLPVLSRLSLAFQTSNVNFSLIRPRVKATKQHLNKIVEEQSPLEKLKGDADSFENLGCDMTFSPTLYQQMQGLSQKYVTALIQNFEQRFASSCNVISALSIFDPLSVPEYEADGFQEYGTAEVNILVKYFFQIETQEVQKLKTEKLLTERSHTKYHVNDNIKKIIPVEVKSGSSRTTTTEWFLLHLLKDKSSFVTFFPLLLYIAEVVVTLPVSNACPERGASVVKNVKTRLRSRLQNEMLQAILPVGINGPDVQRCLPVVKDAVSAWLQAKERRKLPKVPKNAIPGPSLVRVQTSETKEMEVQCEETMAVQSGTVAEEGEHDGIEWDDIDVVLEALNLPSNSLDSDSDSESAFGSDAEEEC